MMSGIVCGSSKVYIQDESSGKVIELGQAAKIELEEITGEYDSFEKDFNIIRHQQEVSISYTPKKLSRKKFIKLLMSRKIQRNAANELANLFLKRRGYYSYLDLILYDGGVL